MGTNKPNSRVLVIHGPNLNMLGKREPEIYGSTTLDELNGELTTFGSDLGLAVEAFQSNSEGEIVNKIQDAFGKVHGLVINPAAYTHTSVAIRDALAMLDVPIIEVHISNIYKREAFRHNSFISGVATGQISGLGIQGYLLAITALSELIESNGRR